MQTFRIPCAHAPALLPLPLDAQVSTRSAAEELGYTFLPCVLVGLSRAPQFVVGSESNSYSGDFWANQVDAVVVPASAFGGSAVLSFSQTRASIIAVENNRTRMEVSPEAVGISAIRVNSYLEALGYLVADRAGISPAALKPFIPSLSCLKDW